MFKVKSGFRFQKWRCVSPALLPTAALTLSTIMPMPSWPESKGPGGFLPFFSGVFSLGEPERQLCFPPTRRGPASMPPRSATVTMHNHTAAESLSGTSGCNIDARSYLSGPFSGINKAKLPLFFCLLAHCSLEIKHCSSLQASTVNFTEFIFLPSCECRADSTNI